MTTNTLSLLEECHKLIDQNLSFIDASENLLTKLEAAIVVERSVSEAKPEFVDRIMCGVSRNEWHDKAWELYQAKAFKDSMLPKNVSVHTLRTIFNATYDSFSKAEMAKPSQVNSQEPVAVSGAPIFFAINGIAQDLHLIENIKTREDLNIVLGTIREQLKIMAGYAKKYTSPKLKPLSDEEIDDIYTTIHMQTKGVYTRKDVVRAIEAKLGAGK